MPTVVLETVRAEGVGVKDLCAGLNVGAVDRGDVLGTFDVPVLGRLAGRKPPLLQERSHSSVKN